MRFIPALIVVSLLGYTATAFAGDAENGNHSALTPNQLGAYSLEFDSNVPHYGPPDPSGLTPMTRETTRPFLGLKLSTPLAGSATTVETPAGRQDQH